MVEILAIKKHRLTVSVFGLGKIVSRDRFCLEILHFHFCYFCFWNKRSARSPAARRLLLMLHRVTVLNLALQSAASVAC